MSAIGVLVVLCLLLVLVVIAARLVVTLITRVDQPPADLAICEHCGYDLAGLERTARCPECNSNERRVSRERRTVDAFHAKWALLTVMLLLPVPYAGALIWHVVMRDVEHLNEPYLTNLAPVTEFPMTLSLMLVGISLLLGSALKAMGDRWWGPEVIVGTTAGYAWYLVWRWVSWCPSWSKSIDTREPGFALGVVLICVTVLGCVGLRQVCVRMWRFDAPAYRDP